MMCFVWERCDICLLCDWNYVFKVVGNKTQVIKMDQNVQNT